MGVPGGMGDPVSPSLEGEAKFPAGLRVMVCDDDPVCLEMVRKMLLLCDYEVTTSTRAEECLQKLRSAEFDLVLSDVYMPDMDGLKLLEIIGREMEMPVIMMSGNSDTSVVLRGITCGAEDYLLKPVRIEELRNLWQHVVRRRCRGTRLGDILAKPDSGESMDACEESVEDDSAKDRPGKASAAQKGSAGKKQEAANKKRRGDGDVKPENPSKATKKVNEEEEEGEDDEDVPKKPRVLWSVELHQKFVTAVNELGMDKVVPKKILDLMNTEGLTREHVASHLQKYRLYLKRLNSAQAGLPPGPGSFPIRLQPQAAQNFWVHSPAIGVADIQQQQQQQQQQALPVLTGGNGIDINASNFSAPISGVNNGGPFLQQQQAFPELVVQQQDMDLVGIGGLEVPETFLSSNTGGELGRRGMGNSLVLSNVLGGQRALDNSSTGPQMGPLSGFQGMGVSRLQEGAQPQQGVLWQSGVQVQQQNRFNNSLEQRDDSELFDLLGFFLEDSAKGKGRFDLPYSR